MKLRISSDWHMYHWPCSTDDERIAFIESNVLPIMPDDTDQILILAGDIFEACEASSIKPICDYIRNRFKDIIYVMGNHEYYGSSWKDAFGIIQKETDLMVSHGTSCIRDISFVCSTLWTPMLATDDLLENGINEFKFIRDCTVDKIREEHRLAKEYMNAALFYLYIDGVRPVVVTHHLPLHECVSQKFKGHPITPAFVANVPELIDTYNPVIWIHGHTHSALDFMYGETRIVCNPFGNYGKEHTGYDPKKIVNMPEPRKNYMYFDIRDAQKEPAD